jgi:hypothetical protein
VVPLHCLDILEFWCQCFSICNVLLERMEKGKNSYFRVFFLIMLLEVQFALFIFYFMED